MRTSPPDPHALLEVPGALTTAGTAGRTITEKRATFLESIGHGTASGGGEIKGTQSGDPTITYRVAPGLSGSLDRGKMPINYAEDLSAYMLEY